METTNTKKAYPTVTPQEFSEVVKNPDVFVLDVRDSGEYSEGHIARAKNIDVQAPDFLEKAEKMLPKNETIAVYCHSGKRSAMASDQLSAAGYKIVNLDGGITNWEASGLPVTK